MSRHNRVVGRPKNLLHTSTLHNGLSVSVVCSKMKCVRFSRFRVRSVAQWCHRWVQSYMLVYLCTFGSAHWSYGNKVTGKQAVLSFKYLRWTFVSIKHFKNHPIIYVVCVCPVCIYNLFKLLLSAKICVSQIAEADKSIF